MQFMRRLKQGWLGLTSRDTAAYWERRYRAGMDSGDGSRGPLAEFKATVLNDLVANEGIESVLELGCGDGQQLALAEYPRYLGLDVSARAIDLCIERFRNDSSKSFLWYDPKRCIGMSQFVQSDLTLSLDVIYHLLEDVTYDAYLDNLFRLSRKWVAVYSSDCGAVASAPHVRHHKFTGDVALRFPDFRLERVIANPFRSRTFADFYLYVRHDTQAAVIR